MSKKLRPRLEGLQECCTGSSTNGQILRLSLRFIYLLYIRPHLEYAAPVWSSDLTKDINKLEHVQKFALRLCTKEWSMSYKDLLGKCHLPELSTRRDHLSLGLLHKIINGSMENVSYRMLLS